METIPDIDKTLKNSKLFWSDNPKVFKCKQVKEFLVRVGIDETLEMAIELDSLSLAQYLENEYRGDPFLSMVKGCTRIRSEPNFLTMTLYPWLPFKFLSSEGRLSRVYNLLLDYGRDIKQDIDHINFEDVPTLKKKYLQPLLNSGFDEGPSGDSDFELYGKTETGVEFLKMIMRGEYTVDGEPLRLTLWHLRRIDLKILDVEAFRMIDEKTLALISRLEQFIFREKCAKLAIKRNDVKFLVDSSLISDTADFRIITKGVFKEAIKRGNFIVLDWILEAVPELLVKCNCDHASVPIPKLSHVPLLGYLFKRLPLCKFLAMYADEHLKDAIKSRSRDWYNQVMAIKGVDVALKEHGLKIPSFPVVEEGANISRPRNRKTMSSYICDQYAKTARTIAMTIADLPAYGDKARQTRILPQMMAKTRGGRKCP